MMRALSLIPVALAGPQKETPSPLLLCGVIAMTCMCLGRTQKYWQKQKRRVFLYLPGADHKRNLSAATPTQC